MTKMTTTSATLFPSMFAVATVSRPRRKNTKVRYITGLNSFGGLKPLNSVTSLGLPVSTEQSFTKVVSSLRAPSKENGRSGGAFSSTCCAVTEIFKIAAVMDGLVLVGVAVAVGFVLLKIEASLQELD